MTKLSVKSGAAANISKPAAPQTSISPLWTRKQVADALGLCIHSVARYTKAGLLPCIKINQRVVRYDPEVVQSFIAAGTTSSQEAA